MSNMNGIILFLIILLYHNAINMEKKVYFELRQYLLFFVRQLNTPKTNSKTSNNIIIKNIIKTGNRTIHLQAVLK